MITLMYMCTNKCVFVCVCVYSGYPLEVLSVNSILFIAENSVVKMYLRLLNHSSTEEYLSFFLFCVAFVFLIRQGPM